MLSSSVGIEPELAPPPSARMPEPGCAVEDVMLALPLLLLSSSVLLPPTDNRAFRCPKLLLYLDIDGFGELETDDGGACSGVDVPFEATIPWGPRDDGIRASANELKVDVRPTDPRGIDVVICSPCEGEAESEGVLNGMNETEGLLPTAGVPSDDRREDLEP